MMSRYSVTSLSGQVSRGREADLPRSFETDLTVRTIAHQLVDPDDPGSRRDIGARDRCDGFPNGRIAAQPRCSDCQLLTVVQDRRDRSPARPVVRESGIRQLQTDGGGRYEDRLEGRGDAVGRG